MHGGTSTTSALMSIWSAIVRRLINFELSDYGFGDKLNEWEDLPVMNAIGFVRHHLRRQPARVERNDRFARLYLENSERETICLGCLATVVPHGFQTLEDAELIHVCAKILKHAD
jgi:hypothetical protein